MDKCLRTITILMIFLLFGLIEQTTSIQCFTCEGYAFYCPQSFNLDDDDKSDEPDATAAGYDAGYACLSEQSFDPLTGDKKIILRGIDHCEEINKPNHRIHCCYENNCNKKLPPMTVKNYADLVDEGYIIESNSQYYIPSTILVCFSIIFQYFLLN